MNDLATLLKEKALQSARCDSFSADFCPYDIAGGHADDTYDAGVSDGEILFARELLSKLFHWTEEEIMDKVKTDE